MCKVTPYLQGVSVSASVNTLAAIAVDRYALSLLLVFFFLIFNRGLDLYKTKK